MESYEFVQGEEHHSQIKHDATPEIHTEEETEESDEANVESDTDKSSDVDVESDTEPSKNVRNDKSINENEKRKAEDATNANNSNSNNVSTVDVHDIRDQDSESDEGDYSSVKVQSREDDEVFVRFGMKIRSVSEGETKQHVIEKVKDNSPAFQIGLRNGDSLVRLNGMGVSQWPHDVLMEQFTLIDADEVHLTIRRANSSNGLGYKELKARFRKTDADVEIATEEMHISESQLPKETDLIIAVYSGMDRVKQCRLQSSSSGSYLKTEGRTIVAGGLDENDDTYGIRREMFNCTDRSPESIYYKQQVNVFVFKVKLHDGSIGYITALGRNKIGIQRKNNLKTRMHSLSRADPRFFFHHFSATGSDCFESTQLPGHYLATDGNKVYLKLEATEKDRDRDSEVHFRTEYQ